MDPFWDGFEKQAISKKLYEKVTQAFGKKNKEAISKRLNRHGSVWQERVMEGKRGSPLYREKPYSNPSQQARHDEHGAWRMAALKRVQK